MKNYGFTLIELLGVMVILALLIMLVFPSIVNSVKSSSEKTDDLTLELIYNAADMHVSSDKSYFEMTNGSTYCVKLSSLIDEGYLKSPIKLSDEDVTDSKVVEVRYQDGFSYELKDSLACEEKKIYFNGKTIYFDVEKGTQCSKTDYDSTNSKTGYNGFNNKTSLTDTTLTAKLDTQNSCLKFYAYNDDGSDTVNLLLDHNTTAFVAWNSSDSNTSGPKEVLDQLKTDTSSWVGTETPANYILDQSNASSGAKFEVDYSTYKARLIMAEEVAQMTKYENWNVASYFYFENNLTTPHDSCKEGNTSGCKYGWLYDRTSQNCTDYGCLNNDTEKTYGFWAITPRASLNYASWIVFNDARLSSNHVNISNRYGVRPVIEVLRSKLS